MKRTVAMMMLFLASMAIETNLHADQDQWVEAGMGLIRNTRTGEVKHGYLASFFD